MAAFEHRTLTLDGYAQGVLDALGGLAIESVTCAWWLPFVGNVDEAPTGSLEEPFRHRRRHVLLDAERLGRIVRGDHIVVLLHRHRSAASQGGVVQQVDLHKEAVGVEVQDHPPSVCCCICHRHPSRFCVPSLHQHRGRQVRCA